MVMSLTSKVTLLAVSGVTVGTIVFVNYKQWLDKKKLHEGVIRDIERQQRRKLENIYFLQQQIEMSKALKKQQSQDEAVALKLLEDYQKKESG